MCIRYILHSGHALLRCCCCCCCCHYLRCFCQLAQASRFGGGFSADPVFFRLLSLTTQKCIRGASEHVCPHIYILQAHIHTHSGHALLLLLLSLPALLLQAGAGESLLRRLLPPSKPDHTKVHQRCIRTCMSTHTHSTDTHTHTQWACAAALLLLLLLLLSLPALLLPAGAGESLRRRLQRGSCLLPPS